MNFKLGDRVQFRPNIIGKVVAIEKRNRNNILLMMDGVWPFLHSGLSLGYDLEDFEYIDLHKMHDNCYWVSAGDYFPIKCADIEDD